MKTALEPADCEFLNALHRIGPKTVQEVCLAVGVTATAVRQRLARLTTLGFVQRERVRQRRGRPHYVYKVTERGLRQLGDNYGDLALILWRELQQIPDPAVRASIAARVRNALVERLGRFGSGGLRERLKRLGEALAHRGYDVEIREANGLPILRENNCPYQELAEADRGICGLEREVFQHALGAHVQLAQCCLDGHPCCDFQVAEAS